MTENQKRKWKDKRYIGLARQSDDKEGNASTIGQLAHLRRECAAVGMSETDVIALDGVTGSMPGRRSDMQALLRRKRERDDFDVIAVHVVDRLTRGGTKHGFWFEHECAMLGLEVFFVGEDIPSGPYSFGRPREHVRGRPRGLGQHRPTVDRRPDQRDPQRRLPHCRSDADRVRPPLLRCI